jgi:hypothetical protein
MNHQIYNKYSQNQNMCIPFNEIAYDFSQIKPTFNPILDICTIKLLGDYIYRMTNFQKWKLCPNLIDEILSYGEDYNIKNQEIINIITKSINAYKAPSYTINDISYFVSDSIKNSLNLNNIDNVEKYFKLKSNYNNFLDKIKLKYKSEWLNIELQYENITNILLENYSELETNLNFQITTEIIDSIGYEASCKVKQLIDTTAILLKNNNILSSQIKIDFDKQLEQIYEQVISSKNFDKLIHDALLDMYGVEKAIHRMSLSLENCSNILNMV